MGRETTTAPPAGHSVITSLGAEPYRLLAPLPVATEETDAGYTAGFVAGNVWASGQTEGEAVEELTSLLLDTYESLSEDRDRLAAAAAREFAALSQYIVPDAYIHQARRRGHRPQAQRGGPCRQTA